MDRFATVSEFVEYLSVVEEDLTAPTSLTPPAAGGAAGGSTGDGGDTGDGGNGGASDDEPESDSLEARRGDLVGGEWRIAKRLGTGSTSRAFLAHNVRTDADEVLKVALSEDKAPRLEHEARVLRGLADSRIIRLARQEPIRVGGRTVLVLAHAGERTVARKLRDEGRLTVDELETFSDYLFGAADYLDGEGVTHRDLKSDNIAIKIRKNRSRQLVLIDFSLAGISVQELEAGTPRYLAPFLGPPLRPVYDAAAERYALAVTLHEMASAELPVWGDGQSESARQTDGPPQLAVEAFDPAIRDGLTAFFLRAFERDARRRFTTLKEMRDAWTAVFRAADAAIPTSIDPADALERGRGGRGGEPDGAETGGLPSAPAGTDAEPLADEAERLAWRARDELAAQATATTPLEAAGLSPRTLSAAHELAAVTVADLLALTPKQLISKLGMGVKTRRELQSRIREWRARLGASPEDGRPPRVFAADLAQIGLDDIAALLVPAVQRTGRNATEVAATRLLLLGLPDDNGALAGLPAWPQHRLVAERLDVTPARIAQVLVKQRRAWSRQPVVGNVLRELIELLAASGRVMSVGELAAALLGRRGAVVDGEELRRAIATAVVRAAVETDEVADEPRLRTRRQGDRILVALEVAEFDDPTTPPAPALLDYAYALGAAADRLAAAEVLPSSATVLADPGRDQHRRIVQRQPPPVAPGSPDGRRVHFRPPRVRLRPRVDRRVGRRRRVVGDRWDGPGRRGRRGG